MLIACALLGACHHVLKHHTNLLEYMVQLHAQKLSTCITMEDGKVIACPRQGCQHAKDTQGARKPMQGTVDKLKVKAMLAMITVEKARTHYCTSLLGDKLKHTCHLMPKLG